MSRKSITIVVSSAGRRVGLIECFRKAARALAIDLRVVACDLAPEYSSACHRADAAYKVPSVTDGNFAPALHDIVHRERADLLVPTIDPELSALSSAADSFASIGCRVHVSPPDVIDIVRDKLETMRVLEAADVPVPRTYEFEEIRKSPNNRSWPLFMKPKAGSASRSISTVRSQSELPLDVDEPMILQDFLDGPEYTVNAFIDANGVLQSAITHRRLRTRAGEVEKGVTQRHPRHAEIARGIVGALPKMRGVFCFQIIEDRSTGPRVIEINARFGGGYPLIDHAGATYAKWLLEEVAELPSTVNDDWRADVLMLRYDAEVFVG